MEKSNIDHLRDIIKELTIANVGKQNQAEFFLKAISIEMGEKDDEIKELEKAAEIKEEEDGYDFENADEVGLDCIFWELQNDNLRIQQEMENFIQSLKKKYIGVAA